MALYPDYEDLILEQQEQREIMEDEPDSPFLDYRFPDPLTCDNCTDRGHCPESQSGAPCAYNR